MARDRLPADLAPGWLLAFTGGQHDPKALLRGLRTSLGDLPVVGGCAPGLITAEATSTTGYECGILLFPNTLMPAAILTEDGLDRDEADPVRGQVGTRGPLLGFYSGVEIASFLGRSRPLDWTGVLVLFALRA